MTRDDKNVIAGYVLGALAAAASLWAGVVFGGAWALAVLVWLAGAILGWILAIVAAPQANEKRDFLKYAKIASAVAAGYLVSKAEVIFNKAIFRRTCSSGALEFLVGCRQQIRNCGAGEFLGRQRLDVDDVPGKDSWWMDAPPERGEAVLPTRPGWGADLVEAVARKHVWEPGRLPGYSAATLMYGR